MERDNSLKRKGIQTAIIVFLFFYLAFCATLSVDSHHDGTMFKACYGIVHGKKLFLEVSTQYGALTSYIQALFLQLFGETVLVMRLSTVVFYCGLFILFSCIFRRFLSTGYLYLAQSLLLLLGTFNYMCFMPWASVYGMFFVLLTVWCFLRAFETGKNLMLFGAGTAAACVFWCRQPLGITACLASIVILIFWNFIWKKGRFIQQILIYITGSTLVNAIFLGIFWLQGSLQDWWTQSILKAYQFANKESVLSSRWEGTLQGHVLINRIVKLVGTLVPINENICWYLLPILCITVFLVYLYLCLKKVVQINEKMAMLQGICIFAISAWGGAYYPVSTIDHYYQPMFLLLGVCIFVLQTACGKINQLWIKAVVSITVLLVIFGPAIYQNYFAKQEIIYSQSFQEGTKSERIVGLGERIKHYDRKWENSEFVCLNGIRLDKEQEKFYLEIIDVIGKIKKDYPDRQLYNMSALHLLKQLEDDGWHPVYSGREELTEYLLQNHPVVISLDDRKELLESLDYRIEKTITIEYPQVIAAMEKKGTEVFIWLYDENDE